MNGKNTHFFAISWKKFPPAKKMERFLSHLKFFDEPIAKSAIDEEKKFR